MSVNEFPVYLVLKCLNQEELTAMMKLNIPLPPAQIKLTTNLSELAENNIFTKVDSTLPTPINVTSPMLDGSNMLDGSVQHINEIASPVPKKRKLDNDKVYYLTDDNEAHDRVLLVGNAQFYIQSEKLIEHSNYFRSLLTSDFKEKKQEIISLHTFNAEKMKIFMDALYLTEDFKFTVEDLGTLIKTFIYFQAVDFLIELFKEKDVLESIPEDKLLDALIRSGVSDLWKAVELLMIAKIGEHYEDATPWTRGRHHSVYARPVRHYLQLSRDYRNTIIKLTNLRDAIDAHLAAEFIQNTPDSLYNNDYSLMLSNHHLVKLTNAIETYAVTVIGEDVRLIPDLYLSGEDLLIEMTDLKKATGDCLLRMYNENEYTEADTLDYCLRMSETCKHSELKERISRSLVEMYNDVGQPNTMKWDEYNNIVFKYDIEPIKSRQEAHLVAEFDENKHYEKLFEYLKTNDLPELKETIENYLVNKFMTTSKKTETLLLDLIKFVEYCHMGKLKDTIEDYFLAEFYSTHSLKRIEYCMGYDMNRLQAVLHNFITSNITINPILVNENHEEDAFFHIMELSISHKYYSYILHAVFGVEFSESDYQD